MTVDIAAARPLADEAVTSLLAPFWQALLGICVVVTVAVATWRLARRGRSRMGTALLVVGGAIVGVTALAILTGGR